MSDNAPVRPPVPDPAEIKVWLEYEYGGLIKELNECRTALKSLVDKYPKGFSDDDAAGIAAENLTIVAAKLKAADERRLDESLAYRTGQRVVNDWFGDYVVGPAIEVRAAVQAMQDRYGQEKLRKAREEAEAKRKAAEEAAQRAAAEAAAAARQGREDALGRAQEAGRAADMAAKAAEDAQTVRARTRGPMGAVSSTAVTWGWEIVDFAEIPDFYKCLDVAKVRDAGRQRGPGGKPTAVIPGLQWVERISVRSR